MDTLRLYRSELINPLFRKKQRVYFYKYFLLVLSMEQEIEPSEILKLLKGIIRKELSFGFEPTFYWADKHNTSIRINCLGYVIDIFVDDDQLDYVDWVVAPDGRKGNYDYWDCELCKENNPIDLLNTQDHDQLIARFAEKQKQLEKQLADKDFKSINDQNGHIIQWNAHKVFYKRDGQGPILLCIHGFPSSSKDFERIWPKLIKRFDSIVPDLIGLGKSAKPKTKLTIGLQADMIEGVLLKLGISESHILAHDLGDTVAQELLARQAEGTNKIKWLSCVFLNGGIFPETHRPLLTQKLLASSLGQLLVKAMSKNTLKKSFINIFSKEHPPTDQFIEETWDLITYNNGRRMIPLLIQYMRERVVNRERWVSPLASNLIPLRLINGVQDPISGAHAAKRFEEVVLNADVVRIADAGHYPHVETSNKVLDALFEFHNSL